MPDGNLNLIGMLWDWMQHLWVVVLGLFGFHFKTQSQKISDLRDKKADKSEMNGAFTELRQSIQHGFDRTHDDINHIHARIDKLQGK